MSMIIAACTMVLRLPGNGSLKGKRSVVKSIVARLHQEFNLSVAEVGAQDQWQEAVIGMVCVSSDRDYAHGLLERAVQWVELNRPDVEVLDYSIEWC